MSVASQATKILSAAKEWPLWLFVASDLYLFAFVSVFGDLVSHDIRRWIEAIAAGFGIFAASRFGSIVAANIKTCRASLAARRTFYLTPVAHECHWGSTRQQDGTISTQITVALVAKSLMPHGSLHLLRARLIRPKLSGEVLTNILLVEDRLSGEYGSAHRTGRHIPPGAIRSVVINMLIRGVPKQSAAKVTPLAAQLAAEYAKGNEQRVRLELRPFDPNATPLRAS
jgi:hypothetical protein